MAMTQQTYQYVGIGKAKNGVRVRYTNNLIGQIKRFTRNQQHAQFMALPKRMNKREAAIYLRDHSPIAQNPEASQAIAHVLGRFDRLLKKYVTTA